MGWLGKLVSLTLQWQANHQLPDYHLNLDTESEGIINGLLGILMGRIEDSERHNCPTLQLQLNVTYCIGHLCTSCVTHPTYLLSPTFHHICSPQDLTLFLNNLCGSCPGAPSLFDYCLIAVQVIYGVTLQLHLQLNNSWPPYPTYSTWHPYVLLDLSCLLTELDKWIFLSFCISTYPTYLTWHP